MRRRIGPVVVLALATLLSACNDNGLVQPTGPNPSPTGTGTPDPNDPFDPTEPPTATSGFVVVDHHREPDGGASMTGMGFFLASSFSIYEFGAGWDLLLSYYDAMGLDSCDLPASDALDINIPENPTFQGMRDAGALELEGPAVEAHFDRLELGGMTTYVMFYEPSYTFIPNTQYHIEGDGAQIPAFREPVTSPGDVTITAPDPTAGPATVDRSADLTLAWTSSFDQQNVVFASIVQYEDTDSEVRRFCRLADDGSATIPASVLADFQPYAVPGDEARLVLYKYRWTTFLLPDQQDPVLLLWNAGHSLDVSFQ